jgi:hypothetical protein
MAGAEIGETVFGERPFARRPVGLGLLAEQGQFAQVLELGGLLDEQQVELLDASAISMPDSNAP